MEMHGQRLLSPEQVEAFYHTDFVEDQVSDFQSLMRDLASDGVVVDLGGGCGFLARRLEDASGRKVRVLDMDPVSVASCASMGIEARVGDALDPAIQGDEDAVCFNLILHHLVGETEKQTRSMQVRALKAWCGRVRAVFVNEYIYESYVGQVSPALIFGITSSKILSAIAGQVAKVIPAFRANTFGVGVRFRSRADWMRLFDEAGYRLVSEKTGQAEPVSPPLRLMIIRQIRRDSYRLEPK